MSLIKVYGMRALVAALVALALGLGAGCSSTSKDPAGDSPEKLYRSAKDDLESGAWDAAIKALERLEGRAVGTVLAQQVLLDMAWAQWKSGERVQAVSTLDRFIKLHPSSPALDYALYLKGLVNFNDSLGFLSSISRQSVSERDQQASRDAYQSFQQLADQFPTSRYADDARVRMDYIVNALAAYEVHVARYYFRRAAYVAAANRAQLAVRDYQGAPANEEALYIMVASYERLGLKELRDDAERVMKRNFPDSRHFREGLRSREQAWWQFW
jgi:outer membrane protein assembly factor BamD